MINNSIINAFNNVERSILLQCITVRHHENATWIYGNDDGLNVTHLTTTIYNSTIIITDTGEGINNLQLTCLSEYSGERRIVNVTTGM